MKGDPGPCVAAGQSEEFRDYAYMQKTCGAKVTGRLDAGVAEGSVKLGYGPFAGMSQIFSAIGGLCENPQFPGAREDLAARLKVIHIVSVPTPPYDSNNMDGRAMTFKFAAGELTVGEFPEASNVGDQTVKWLVKNVTYDAFVQARLKLYVQCFAGDPNPCGHAMLGQYGRDAAELRKECGSAPKLVVEEKLVRALDKSRFSLIDLVDQTMGGMVANCDNAGGKAKFAGVGTVHFTFSTGKPPKGVGGNDTISLTRNGSEVVITDYDGVSDVGDAATRWVKKNL